MDLFLDNNKSIKRDNKSFWDQESKFWNCYGKIYKHLEAATPYRQMLEEISKLISAKKYETWLVAGCGPGTMINLILENQKSIKKIYGIDFDGVMLDQATKRMSTRNVVVIKHSDLSNKINFPDGYFDGIIANLVLSYIIIFENKYSGEQALKMSLFDMFRLLKSGGIFIWSTPIENVKFYKVFLSSWREL